MPTDDFEMYLIQGINPVPWKAPNASALKTKSGFAIPKLSSPAELKNYQEAIKEAAMEPPPVLMEHERLDLRFFFWRQAGTKHDHQADATNMQKALEDVLQGILYVNDSAVVHVESTIQAQGPDVEPNIIIEIGPAPDRYLTGLLPANTHQVPQSDVLEPDNFEAGDYF